MQTRREIIRMMGMTALAFTGLSQWLGEGGVALAGSPRLGPLEPDPAGIFDLPKDFHYRIISRVGQPMGDGLLVPGSMDGMAAYPGPGGTTLLVRNHELEPRKEHHGWSPYGAADERFKDRDPTALYDARDGKRPDLGGTTTVVYDTLEQLTVRQFLSLAGTRRNCAGGATPWGTWLSCEETTAKAGATSKRDHGYVFEVVPSADPHLEPAKPLRAMGRFRHEAAAVDPISGAVYMTEDLADGLLYRFLPKVPGQLARGGRLQALALRDFPKARTHTGFKLGGTWPVRWVDLGDPDSPRNTLRKEGFAAGAAQFARGEGMWVGSEGIYFCATNGGPKHEGQVWRYTPSRLEGQAGEAGRPGTLTLFLQPENATVLENGDNLTVAPWGDLVICEDHVTPKRVPETRLMGVTPAGAVYPIGHNRVDKGKSELAGACFSPDGSTLFVNIQFPGMTLAITGPWPKA